MRITACLVVSMLPALVARADTGAGPGHVSVKVIEVAERRAYLEPGAAAGLRRGQEVHIAGVTYVVIETTSKHAVVTIGAANMRVGDAGDAVGTPVEAVGPRPAPSPLTRFAGQWKDPVRPAARQKPKAVQLGPDSRRRTLSLAVIQHGRLVLPDSGGAAVAGELGLRLSYEPWREIGVDADASAVLWGGGGLGGDSAARPPARVRELRLRWGERGDPGLALGRLRWAAATVGALDGARVSVPLSGALTAGGFGGFVPDPVDGRPRTAAARFGGELVLDVPRSRWRPRGTLTALGSTFDGALDERRLTAAFDLAPGPAAIAAYAELSLFDAGNPWGLRKLEVTAAGIDVAVRNGRWYAAAGGGLLQPERSRYLESVLLRSWLCTAKVLPPGSGPEPCAGDLEARLSASASAGVAVDGFTLDVGGAVRHGGGGGDLDEQSAFILGRALRLWGRGRLELELDATRAPFLDLAGGRISAGALLPGDRIDLLLHYRAALLRYVAALDDILEHRAGVEVSLVSERSLEVRMSAELTASPEYRAFTLLTSVVWRSRP